MKRIFHQLLLVALFLATAHVSAQILERPVLNAVRLAGTIQFDGLVAEPTWEAVPPTVLRQQVPHYDQPPSEGCEIFLAYDDEYLYMAGRMHLSDSAFYRGTTFKRDATEGSTDYFGLVIDSYNDNENALSFFTTPTGLRWDGTVSNDAQSFETSVGIDWNTFWDAAARRTPSGWSAEIRIPWSSLRFQERNGEVIMGINMWWYLAAKNEQVMFPLVPLNWGEMGAWKPSQMQKYRFTGLRSRKPLYLTPYLLGGVQQDSKLNSESTAYYTETVPKIEAGLDLKYSLTSNLTLDLTANTDFAQVEVDDQQVNLTRFNLFFPEKRQFFLERASIFDFQFERDNRLFYSRRIGISDGVPVRIFGGARVQGRVGKHDLGLLTMQTAAPADSLQSENFSVLRVRRQAFNPYSYLGLLTTNRTDFDGNYNTTYGLDGTVRVTEDDYLAVKFAQSYSNLLDKNPFSIHPTRAFLFWEKRRYDNFSYRLSYSHAGKDWKPGMGFEDRGSYDSGRMDFSYGWVFGSKSKLLRLQAFQETFILRNYVSAKVETTVTQTGFEMETKKGWFLNPTLVVSREYVPEAFSLGEAVVPIDDYGFGQLKVVAYSPFAGKIGLFLEMTGGGFYDGQLGSINLMPRWNVSPHLRLEGTYQYSHASFAERKQAYTAHLGKLKAEYLFNTKFSLAAFLQYSSDEEIFVENVRFRYNPKEGNDLFVVFNDVVNGRRSRELPQLPFSDNRAIVVKYTYTFRLS